MPSRAILPILLLALLGACASSFRSEVARFHQLPAAGGETFTIQPEDPEKLGSLEFQQYAQMVSQQLIQEGYQPATSPATASLVVRVDYGVSDGRERIATRPGFGGFGYRYSYFPYSRYYWPYHWRGFYDPFWGPYGAFDAPEIYSYTVYTSFLDLEMRRAASNEVLFEGRAEANTRDDDLTELVPNLVQAMFTNFPGRSGETVLVKVDPETGATPAG